MLVSNLSLHACKEVPLIGGEFCQSEGYPSLQDDYKAANEAKQRAGDAAQQRAAAQASQVKTAL